MTAQANPNPAIVGARDLVGSLLPALAWAHHRATRLARNFDRRPDHDLARGLGLAREVADNIADDLVYGRAPNRLAAIALNHALTSHRELAVDSDLAVHLDRARDLVHNLVVTLSDEAGVADGGEQRRKTVVTRSAARLVAGASRLLPPANRGRYSEEFDAEMWNLAEAGASRWRQIAHAIRLFTHTWELRRELKTPHPQKASW